MKSVATGLLFDKNNRLLIYLRDDKPTIPFPNHWDLFGGHVEDGETPQEALVREIQEELGVCIASYEYFRTYQCLTGDVAPNVKHVYWTKLDDVEPSDLTLYEGQAIDSIGQDEINERKFANILGSIIADFLASGLWPKT